MQRLLFLVQEKKKVTMNGEIATIQLHLFPNGIYAECEETEDGTFIPIGDMKPLCEFINKVQGDCDPDATFVLTEKGKKIAEGYERGNKETS